MPRRVKKKKSLSLSDLRKEAWKWFSLYIRHLHQSDGYCRCYTCDLILPIGQIQAGHAIGGRTNSVLLDEEIVKPQCVRCNVMLRGNYPVFTARLIREHGLDWFENKLAESRKPKKLNRAFFIERAEWYKEYVNAQS